MAKVYVITAGSYSDYHICAVSLDPQKAEVLAKFYTEHGYDQAGVEEYEADYEYDRIESGCQMASAFSHFFFFRTTHAAAMSTATTEMPNPARLPAGTYRSS